MFTAIVWIIVMQYKVQSGIIGSNKAHKVSAKNILRDILAFIKTTSECVVA